MEVSDEQETADFDRDAVRGPISVDLDLCGARDGGRRRRVLLDVHQEVLRKSVP